MNCSTVSDPCSSADDVSVEAVVDPAYYDGAMLYYGDEPQMMRVVQGSGSGEEARELRAAGSGSGYAVVDQGKERKRDRARHQFPQDVRSLHANYIEWQKRSL